MGFYFFIPMISIQELYQIYLQFPVVVTDTRSLVNNCLFLCLKGSSFDGNQFAQTALEQGARYAVIDDPKMQHLQGSLLVEDVLSTLQALAAFHRNQLSIPVIGITGTNGKTTTKELLTAVLSKKYRITATRGNLNNHIGVPLTLLSIRPDTEMAIVEMGANHPGEIADLCEIARPTAGIVTNIGKAHLEGFGSLENIIETKTALYRSVHASGGPVFINASNQMLRSRATDIHYIIYGEGAESVAPGILQNSDPYVAVRWGKAQEHITTTKLAGAWNFENIMAAICIGQYYKVSDGDIHEALATYTPNNMRSQIRQTADNTILLDAYNANPTSMRAALQHFAKVHPMQKTLILGDMLELGVDADVEHQSILELTATLGFKKVIVVGKIFGGITGFSDFLRFSDTSSLCEYLKSNPLQGDEILIKGSRGIGLEKVVDVL